MLLTAAETFLGRGAQCASLDLGAGVFSKPSRQTGWTLGTACKYTHAFTLYKAACTSGNAYLVHGGYAKRLNISVA